MKTGRAVAALVLGALAAVAVAGCASTALESVRPGPTATAPEPQPEPPERPPVATALRLVAGGDVMFGRYFFKRYRASGGEAPFAELAHHFAGADLGFVNLETPLYDGIPERIRQLRERYHRDLRFRAPTSRAAQLAEAGISVVSLGNNHLEDAGREGIASTMAALDAAGIHHAGAALVGDPLVARVFEVSGVRVGLIAATSWRNDGEPSPGRHVPVAYGSLFALADEMPRRVSALLASGEVDLVLVSLHWGPEFAPKPLAAQRQLAHALIRAGASVVLGHHGHVLGAVESFEGGLILYDMGNLVFDMISRSTKDSALFDIRLSPDVRGRWRATELVMRPVVLRGRMLGPRPAIRTEPSRILEPVADLSARHFRTLLRRRGDELFWRAAGEVFDLARPDARGGSHKP